MAAAETVGDGAQQNRLCTLAFLECAFALRVDEALSHMSPDVSWWTLGDPQKLRAGGTRNKTEAEKFLRGMARVMPGGMQAQIKGVTAQGNRVAVEAEGIGILASGQRYHNRYHFQFELQDGLISVIREYMDTLEVASVFGERGTGRADPATTLR